MKPIRVAESIIPLGEFKAKASKLLRDLNEENGPLIITQNGRPAAVVLAPEAFDRMQKEQALLEAVAEGLSDAEAGRTVDHRRVAEWLSQWGTDGEGEPPL